MNRYLSKEILARNFSRCAHLYDAHADIQRLAASKLVPYLPEGGVKRILEIGCGTGIFTARLKEKFPNARIDAMDISDRMVEAATAKLRDPKISFLVCDAEEIECREKFDLIASNAAFQWFGDIERALTRYRAVLTGKGVLVFSAFGPETFQELKAVLRAGHAGGQPAISEKFLGKDALEKVLARHFSEASVDEIVVRKIFSSLVGLLKSIKYTGVRGAGTGNGFIWKREILKLMEDIYRSRYGAIEASYQIFFCRADR